MPGRPARHRPPPTLAEALAAFPTTHGLLDAGVDGLITDRPDILREVLIARGQWHRDDLRPRSLTPLP